MRTGERALWRRVVGAALGCALLALAKSPGALAESDSHTGFAEERAIVETLHGALLESMRRGANRSFDARRGALEPVLAASFDFSFMAEKSAGRHWRDLNETERVALRDAMSELAVSNYAARFNAYDGERFDTTGAEVAPYETVLVRTEIRRGRDTLTRLDYRLHRDARGDPRIVDIFLNGTVSELAMRRAEYSSVIKREGFGALLSALHERVSALPVSAGRAGRASR